MNNTKVKSAVWPFLCRLASLKRAHLTTLCFSMLRLYWLFSIRPESTRRKHAHCSLVTVVTKTNSLVGKTDPQKLFLEISTYLIIRNHAADGGLAFRGHRSSESFSVI
jgi:hypothetical protein